MHDPHAVAAIVDALRHAHGDAARLMLEDGMTLEALIDALLRAPLSNRDAARQMTARLDDPELIEKVAIAIFERTQGSWEYAREADREWLRLEAQAAIATF